MMNKYDHNLIDWNVRNHAKGIRVANHPDRVEKPSRTIVTMRSKRAEAAKQGLIVKEYKPVVHNGMDIAYGYNHKTVKHTGIHDRRRLVIRRSHVQAG